MQQRQAEEMRNFAVEGSLNSVNAMVNGLPSGRGGPS